MKVKNILIGAFAAGMFFLTVGNAFSQRQDPRGKGGADSGEQIEQQLKALKTGQWIDIKGVPQKNGIIETRKMKMLTGDFAADDCEVRGRTRRIDLEKKEFQILELLCGISEETEFEQSGQGGKKFAKFADIKPDMLIEAEGMFKDGKFIADEMQNESATEDEDKLNEVAATGQIQEVDVKNRIVKIMNLKFRISSNTKIKKGL